MNFRVSMELINRTWKLIHAQISISPRQSLSQLRRWPSYKSYEALIDRSRLNASLYQGISLDLGSSLNFCNIFKASTVYGLDISPGDRPECIQCDLFRGVIPFSENFATYVTAADFLEHVPRISIGETKTRFPFVELISEVHRVLQPGGIFFQASPAFPMKEAFQDPTHVNIISEDTFPRYFCRGMQGGAWARIYGFTGEFELICQGWVGPRLVTIMKKI